MKSNLTARRIVRTLFIAKRTGANSTINTGSFVAGGCLTTRSMMTRKNLPSFSSAALSLLENTRRKSSVTAFSPRITNPATVIPRHHKQSTPLFFFSTLSPAAESSSPLPPLSSSDTEEEPAESRKATTAGFSKEKEGDKSTLKDDKTVPISSSGSSSSSKKDGEAKAAETQKASNTAKEVDKEKSNTSNAKEDDDKSAQDLLEELVRTNLYENKELPPSVTDENPKSTITSELLSDLLQANLYKERAEGALRVPRPAALLKKKLEDEWTFDYSNVRKTTMSKTTDSLLEVKVHFSRKLMQRMGLKLIPDDYTPGEEGEDGDGTPKSREEDSDADSLKKKKKKRALEYTEEGGVLDEESLFRVVVTKPASSSTTTTSNDNNDNNNKATTLVFDYRTEGEHIILVDVVRSGDGVRSPAEGSFKVVQLLDGLQTFAELQLGIKEDIGRFIHHYNSYRRRRDYVKFLTDAKEALAVKDDVVIEDDKDKKNGAATQAGTK